MSPENKPDSWLSKRYTVYGHADHHDIIFANCETLQEAVMELKRNPGGYIYDHKKDEFFKLR